MDMQASTLIILDIYVQYRLEFYPPAQLTKDRIIYPKEPELFTLWRARIGRAASPDEYFSGYADP
jgi:hypothetical protein